MESQFMYIPLFLLEFCTCHEASEHLVQHQPTNNVLISSVDCGDVPAAPMVLCENPPVMRSCMMQCSGNFNLQTRWIC